MLHPRSLVNFLDIWVAIWCLEISIPAEKQRAKQNQRRNWHPSPEPHLWRLLWVWAVRCYRGKAPGQTSSKSELHRALVLWNLEKGIPQSCQDGFTPAKGWNVGQDSSTRPLNSAGSKLRVEIMGNCKHFVKPMLRWGHAVCVLFLDTFCVELWDTVPPFGRSLLHHTIAFLSLGWFHITNTLAPATASLLLWNPSKARINMLSASGPGKLATALALHFSTHGALTQLVESFRLGRELVWASWQFEPKIHCAWRSCMVLHPVPTWTVALNPQPVSTGIQPGLNPSQPTVSGFSRGTSSSISLCSNGAANTSIALPFGQG